MDPLQPLIDSLHQEGRLRVWSLVITIFGDSVQHRGGRIPTVRLNRILGRIGVEPGALRTALSRLAQDGWVESRREGRSSSYALTDKGLQSFAPATEQIYAPARTDPVATWVFETAEGAPGLAVAGGRLRPEGDDAPARGFRITGTLAPQSTDEVWAGIDTAQKAAMAQMQADLNHLNGRDPADPLSAIAARTLLIHRWRRLILRWPEIPAELIPDACTPRNLRAATGMAYARLSPLAERWLDAPCGDAPAMPVASSDFAKRFKGLQKP